MRYLQCGHCARHSALKSGYITFCDHCGKKFPLTFAAWQAHHPQGSFEEFAEETGISEEARQAAERKSQHWIFTIRQKAALITGIVVLVACSTLGAWYGPGLVKMFSKPTVPAAMLETGNWRTFRGNVLRLQTPLSLSPADRKDMPNLRFKAFTGGGRAEGLEITMEEAIFLSHSQVDLEPSARKAADVLARQKGVSQFSYSEKRVQLNGAPAMWQQGSYVQDHSAPMEFSSLVVVKGGISVQVLVIHPGNDSTGRRVAEEVLKSAQMN
ncbi:hypothetical protein [Chitinophaga alhagiae]|uniref:hypothetical protein n=1 Tax=Chitinophaga alhagiae TaxID=2203219 RepID=UPI000E5AF08C|nr:hypothetical protein [Chitinophaga alhagiae]